MEEPALSESLKRSHITISRRLPTYYLTFSLGPCLQILLRRRLYQKEYLPARESWRDCKLVQALYTTYKAELALFL